MSFVFWNARKCHFTTPVMFHFAEIKTFESQNPKIFTIQKFCRAKLFKNNFLQSYAISRKNIVLTFWPKKVEEFWACNFWQKNDQKILVTSWNIFQCVMNLKILKLQKFEIFLHLVLYIDISSQFSNTA